MIIDKATITVKGGSGGDGCMSFRREKFVPRGGPNGGDGGRGGNVYLKAESRLKTLLDFVRKPSYEAGRGSDGMGYHKSGKDGDNLTLEVPCGTMVYRGDVLVADLKNEGDIVLLSKGGRGGRGNVHFKSSTRQAPRIAEGGEPAEIVDLRLELKLIADVGLIGMPNAGKSTLLSRLTRARPKIANYPFTTLFPNLGVAVYHDREIIFADIPGLIEGSHQGKGLGHEFLQHIERTSILVHVVDPLGFGNKTPKACIKIINDELRKYSPTLAKKPQMMAVNKQDLTEADLVFKEVKRSVKTKKVLAVSGVTGQGIDQLLAEVTRELAIVRPVEAARTVETPSYIHLEPEFWVEKSDDTFVVKGKKVEKLVAMTKFNLPEAVIRTQHILRKIGVERALQHQGAAAGDLVQIADFEFTFEPDKGAE